MILLLALGSWQTHRLFWKTELNEFRAAQSTAEPMALPAAVDDVDALAYRPVWLEGSFRHDEELFLAARTHLGKLGYQVVTPFERTDGQVVLINRGWIPLEAREPSSRAEGQVAGPLRIEGLVVPGGSQGWFVPDNQPSERFWYWLDLKTLSEVAGISEQSFLVDAGPAPNPGGVPIGGQTRLELRNEHLQYAILWFALAVGLAAIYVIYMRRGTKSPDHGTE